MGIVPSIYTILEDTNLSFAGSPRTLYPIAFLLHLPQKGLIPRARWIWRRYGPFLDFSDVAEGLEKRRGGR